MKLSLQIVGTDHRFQFGAGVWFGGKPLTSESEAAFDQMLREVVAAVNADTLAEELSIESLHDVGKTESTVQRLARRLGIGHVFCDPDRGERTQLSIRDENEIRASVMWERRTEDWIKSEILAATRRREEEWLRRIREHGGCNVVFVCGANHVKQFSEMVLRERSRIVIAHEDWTYD